MKPKRSDTENKENVQRSGSNRVLKSQDQNKPAVGLQEGNKGVSPFELFPSTGHISIGLSDLKRIVRSELEIAERERQLNGPRLSAEANLRDIRMEIGQVKHLLNSRIGESKGLETYVNSRLQHITAEAQQRYESLKTAVSQLERKSNERFTGLQCEMQSIESKVAREGRSAQKQTTEHSRLSVLESNFEQLFQKLKTPIVQPSDSTLSVSQDANSVSVDIEKQLRGLRNEFKMTVASIHLHVSSIEEELQVVSKELSNKINVNDLSETIEDLRDGIKQHGFGMEKANDTLEELRKEQDELGLRLFKAEECLAAVQSNTESRLANMRKSVDDHLQSLTDSLETKLGRIVSSYNLNFEEIDVTCEDLRTMLSEVLNINSLLSSRLLKIVTHKIDSSAFQSTIENLNEQISSELFVNSRKIHEIGEKEFEVQHQLKSLKEILEGLRTDYQRNYNRLRLEDDKSSHYGSGSKNMRPSLEHANEGMVSPKDVEQLFKKADGPYDCYSTMERKPHGRQRSNLSRSIRQPSHQRLSDELMNLQ